jgi:DNA gyrase subunit A
MGRDSTGVRGVKLAVGQTVIALIVVGEGHVLTASANGYGKLTPLEDFPPHGRGGQGVIALQTTDRNGETVAALQVAPEHELMLISSNGTLVRTPVNDVSVVGRNTQGVRLIRLDEGDRLTGVERVESLGEEFDGPAEGDIDGASAGADPAGDDAAP